MKEYLLSMSKALFTAFLLLSVIPAGLRGFLFAGPVSLADLQKRALAENPRLMAMRDEAEMMKRRVPPSASLADPKVKLALNNVPTDGFSLTREDMTSKEVGVSQMIPLGGKLGSRERIAVREYERAVERLRKERIEILHMLRMSAYEIEYVRSSERILGDIKKQLKLLIESEIAASKTGSGSLSGVIKINIEYTMIDEELIALRQQGRDASQKINYLAGGPVDPDDLQSDTVEFLPMNAEEARRRITAANPDLKIRMIEKEIAREELSLKKREYVPDMELGVSYMQRDAGPMGARSDMVTGMATFTVPAWFWKRNMPMVEEMEKKGSSADNLVKDTANSLDARAGMLIAQMDRWRDLHALYRDRLIPQAELALEADLARYKTGTVNFMSVIDTVRMLLRYRKELEMAKKEYAGARSELNALMGREVMQ